MKVKILDLINAAEAIKTTSGKELPTKLSYWLSRLTTKIEKPLKTYEEKRMELFKKFGTLDGEKQQYSVPADKLPDFQKEILSLIEIEEEITFEPIKLEYFEGEKFTSIFFQQMDKFIIE